MKISVIIPLIDRRTAGLAALSSALAQEGDGSLHETVVVLPRDGGAMERDPEVAARLARCDAIVRTDLDADDVDNEILFYEAALDRARGDLVFFAEGHTALMPGCIAAIARFFEAHPEVELAWGGRCDMQETSLGHLIAMNNARHERLAVEHGQFSLGANSVIRRRTLDALGGLDRRFLRFAEVVLCERAKARGTAIGRIDALLSRHSNDVALRKLIAIMRMMGRGKARYVRAAPDGADAARRLVAHPAYRLAASPAAAVVVAPLAIAAGALMMAGAVPASRVSRALGFRLYDTGAKACDLSGFCAETLVSS